MLFNHFPSPSVPFQYGSPDPRSVFVLKVVSWCYCPSPSCIDDLNLLASMTAKINTRSQFFGCSPSPDPCRFWSHRLFLGKLSPSPSCIPNLKLLASTVAEINRGSRNILDAPVARPLPIFIVQVVSRQATPQAQVVYQI